MHDKPINHEQPRDWYFSFGAGQTFAGRYHIIHDTLMNARCRMFAAFGDQWCTHYPDVKSIGVDEYNLTELK